MHEQAGKQRWQAQRKGLRKIGEQGENAVTQPCQRLTGLNNSAEVDGNADNGSRMWLALLLIAGKNSRGCLPFEGQREFPAEIGGIADACTHALAQKWRHL